MHAKGKHMNEKREEEKIKKDYTDTLVYLKIVFVLPTA